MNQVYLVEKNKLNKEHIIVFIKRLISIIFLYARYRTIGLIEPA